MPSYSLHNFFGFRPIIDWDQIPSSDLTSDKFSSLRKFLHFGDIHKIRDDETIKISNSKVFRDEYFKMEVANHRINDPEEGRANYLQDGYVTEDVVQGGNIVSAVVEPFHLLSLTFATFDDGCEAFCRPDVGLNEPYDACVEIADMPEFMKILSHLTFVYNPGSCQFDIPIDMIFQQVFCSEVIYKNIEEIFSSDVRAFAPPRPSPFIKDNSLLHQQEFRLLFRPSLRANACRVPPTPLIAKLPGLSKLLKIYEPADIDRVLVSNSK